MAEIDCLSVGILVADHLCSPIERMPRAGELVIADALPLEIGGCASNAGVDLAKQGVRVAVVGCVGDDVFGSFLIESLARAGVDTTSIRRAVDRHTSATLIVNVAGEDRRFIHTVGANACLTVDDVPVERLRSARVFYVGGYLLMPGIDQLRLAALFRQARSWGVTTVLDVVLPGPGDYWSALEHLLPETDVFLPNTDEASVITGLSDPQAQALRFHAAGARTVVITCGGSGTILVNDRQRLRAAAYRQPFVGGTGAGDAFDAGFIAGLLDGANAVGCLARGSALGASCVRSISATASVFTRAEADAFLSANPLKVEAW